MAALVAAIYSLAQPPKAVDARHKAGHEREAGRSDLIGMMLLGAGLPERQTRRASEIAVKRPGGRRTQNAKSRTPGAAPSPA